MSNNIRQYFDDDGCITLSVTAFVGKTKSVQLTVANHCWVSLDQHEILDLIRVLTARLMGKKGYSATDQERKNIRYKR